MALTLSCLPACPHACSPSNYSRRCGPQVSLTPLVPARSPPLQLAMRTGCDEMLSVALDGIILWDSKAGGLCVGILLPHLVPNQGGRGGHPPPAPQEVQSCTGHTLSSRSGPCVSFCSKTESKTHIAVSFPRRNFSGSVPSATAHTALCTPPTLRTGSRWSPGFR